MSTIGHIITMLHNLMPGPPVGFTGTHLYISWGGWDKYIDRGLDSRPPSLEVEAATSSGSLFRFPCQTKKIMIVFPFFNAPTFLSLTWRSFGDMPIARHFLYLKQERKLLNNLLYRDFLHKIKMLWKCFVLDRPRSVQYMILISLFIFYVAFNWAIYFVDGLDND